MLAVQDGVALAPYTTFKVGGAAKKFVVVRNIEELTEALHLALQQNWPICVLGGGSNVIVSSAGFNGLVIKVEIGSRIISKNRIISGAGVPMSDLVALAVTNNLAGLEWAGGLPGSLGGAVRGNAGCFGSEIKDCVETVISLDHTNGQTVTRTARQCQFGYRNSIFKERENEIIVSVSLKLTRGDRAKLQKVVDEHIAYRQAKHPMDLPNAGSVFKNIPVQTLPAQLVKTYEAHIKQDPFPVLPAARIIADAGLAGHSVGGAAVSTKHTNYIVNQKNASPEDIVELIKSVKSAVRDKFGITLEVEQQLIGF